MNFVKRIACYTCITGDYDVIKPVLYPDSEVDYLLFSNQTIEAPFPWQVVIITPDGLDNKDSGRTVKIRPHLLSELASYDACVYIDGNVQVIGRIREFVEKLINDDMDVHFFHHPYRRSVKEEIRACAYFGHSWAWLLLKQYQRYRNARFPDSLGLFETGIMIWRPTLKAKEFAEIWWAEYCRDAKRDQIALPYAIWKAPPLVGNLGINNIRHGSNYFKLHSHKHGFRWINKFRRLINFPLWIFHLKQLRFPKRIVDIK